MGKSVVRKIFINCKIHHKWIVMYNLISRTRSEQSYVSLQYFIRVEILILGQYGVYTEGKVPLLPWPSAKTQLL